MVGKLKDIFRVGLIIESRGYRNLKHAFHQNTIQVVKESKALGVFIDQKVSWKKQVTTVRKSFNTKIKLLKGLTIYHLMSWKKIIIRPLFHQLSTISQYGEAAH